MHIERIRITRAEHPALIERRQHRKGKQNRPGTPAGRIALGGFLEAEVGPSMVMPWEHPPGELAIVPIACAEDSMAGLASPIEVGRRMPL